MKTADDVPASGRTDSGRAFGQGRVLVVDDSPEIRRLLATILEALGYPTDVAGGGREAQARIAQERPALIVTDLRMPDGDGWELLEYCRAFVSTVPVVIISGEGLGTHPELEGWAVATLRKPFGLKDVTEVVRRQVGARCASVTGLPIRAA